MESPLVSSLRSDIACEVVRPRSLNEASGRRRETGCSLEHRRNAASPARCVPPGVDKTLRLASIVSVVEGLRALPLGTTAPVGVERAETVRHMQSHQYLIMVNGGIRDTHREWLGHLAIERQAENYTALRRDMDQSALLGVLSLLRHLALEVFEVRRVCQCASPRQSCVAIENRRRVVTQ